jgi:hypothetical protein
MNTFTHEMFIHRVAEIACSKLSTTDASICGNIKLAYGAGPDGTRGVTYYNQWGKADTQAPFVAINALHQESLVQLAGTTIHELGHVLAGWEAGHGPDWKAACEKLGLRRIKAARTEYIWSMFDKDIRTLITQLPKPTDGEPISLWYGLKVGKRKSGPKPCTAAIGVRGGTSRGVGSGSRLRLFECKCDEVGLRVKKVRIASDEFNCTCNDCNNLFFRVV